MLNILKDAVFDNGLWTPLARDRPLWAGNTVPRSSSKLGLCKERRFRSSQLWPTARFDLPSESSFQENKAKPYPMSLGYRMSQPSYSFCRKRTRDISASITFGPERGPLTAQDKSQQKDLRF